MTDEDTARRRYKITAINKRPDLTCDGWAVIDTKNGKRVGKICLTAQAATRAAALARAALAKTKGAA